MKYAIYASIDEMLAPETLSRLAGQPITSVQTRLIEAAYNKSGSRLLLVETGGGPRYVLKQVAAEWDWQMRATDDRACRTVTLWRTGVFDRLPPEIEHGVVACASDGAGWAILMRDLNGALTPYASFSPGENAAFLVAMAAQHAAFFEAPDLSAPELNLCGLTHVYGVFGPETGRREAAGANEVPRRMLEGWDLMSSVVDPDVAEITLALAHEPRPLVETLSRFPHTLVHGDWRHANQGLIRGRPPRVVLLDWQLAAVAPPAVDLARYLGTNSALLPISKEACITFYREQLARRLGNRFDESWWLPQLELGLLGGFVQDGWAIVLKATHWAITAHQREHWQADVVWWSEWVRRGARWL